ncbi:MAG: hypothetical protein P8Y73_00970 [Desulfuromonadales bacterium]
MINHLKFWMGRLMALTFLTLSLSLLGLACVQFFEGFAAGQELVNIMIKSINTGIIALAIFELGIGIGKEYGKHQEDEDHTYMVVRRTIARFVGTVCIALVLEGLIMIIKYSQLDLAGNLYYPVGILIGSSVLLAGLGVFLQLTRADCEKQPGRLVPVMVKSEHRRSPAMRPRSERQPQSG